MTRHMLMNDLKDLIAARNWNEVQARVKGWPATELAEALAETPGPVRILLFRALPGPLAVEVFAHLEGSARDSLLADFTDEETRAVLADLDPDDRTQLFTELPGPMVQRLLNFLAPHELAEARMLLGYPEESVGRLMTPNYVMVRTDWTVDRALAHIRNREAEFETVNVVYVAASDGRLLDAIGLRRLVLAAPETTIHTLVRGPVISLKATDDREEAVRVMSRYDLPVLPVVDSAGVLLGIVTSDDVLDVAEAETTEDFHRMAPIGLMKRSLKDAGVAVLWRARVGWLLVLVFMNIFSGAGIEFFEDTLAATISLAFFLPLLIDSGGNAGSQAATLMVRALATGEVKMRDWVRLLGKEVGVALLLGLTMAAGVALIASFRAPEVMVVVSLTMTCVVLVGSLIGTALPFLLTRFGYDPATASAPLITSLADIAGVMIYFSIATWYLGL
jgi:magnesium transporter